MRQCTINLTLIVGAQVLATHAYARSSSQTKRNVPLLSIGQLLNKTQHENLVYFSQNSLISHPTIKFFYTYSLSSCRALDYNKIETIPNGTFAGQPQLIVL